MRTSPNRIRIGVRAGVRVRSHERTNERTYGERTPDVDHETAVDARARIEKFAAIETNRAAVKAELQQTTTPDPRAEARAALKEDA